jgi:hypothetical protein
VITNENNRIEVISPVYVGSTHDFAIFKEENFPEVLPSKTPVYIDTGFEGAHKLNEKINYRKPVKKPKNKKLNGGQKLGNKLISRTRVKVEHVIGHMKKFKIVADKCRNISRSMDSSFEIICGIVNFQIDRRV